ncbi:MAG: hypothetical protein DRP71_02630 [Verrucomicrobia bacterium]|nr:MAG: hypothetical protein DRP71_02630 [Verrucomicrobiota bacterium]
MNDEQIDSLLRELQRDDRPEPPDLRPEARAEIARLRDRPGFLQRLLPVLSWNELLMQPRLAAGALAIAITIGMIPGAWTLARAQSENKAEFARRSLHLDVFDTVGFFTLKVDGSDTPGR